MTVLLRDHLSFSCNIVSVPAYIDTGVHEETMCLPDSTLPHTQHWQVVRKERHACNEGW